MVKATSDYDAALWAANMDDFEDGDDELLSPEESEKILAAVLPNNTNNFSTKYQQLRHMSG